MVDGFPLERVAYVHVAGGAEHPADPGVYHDTHTLHSRAPDADGVWVRAEARPPPAVTVAARRPLPARGAAARAELDGLICREWPRVTV